MNIFFLSLIPSICAEYHCDKHVVKMILETTQLLWTCFQVLMDNEDWKEDCPVKIYSPTFKNHPMGIWTRRNSNNYSWLLHLGIALCKEYTHRYKKTHVCQSILEWLHLQFHSHSLPSKNLFSTKYKFKKEQSLARVNVPDGCSYIPLCMPEECKGNDPVVSYRMYYKKEKVRFAKWTNRPIPPWFSS